MLALEVEYLSGVAYAADDRGDGADWPPQPDRLFSALVASWAARGSPADEREALEWLEAREPPRIAASTAHPRSVVKSYVPPNDDAATAITVMPAHRRRQERHFPAAIPDHPVVRFIWQDDPAERHLTALSALARDTSYLGHSASLVRCRALILDAVEGTVRPPRRRVHEGRLKVLERQFHAGKRPPPGPAVPTTASATGAAPPQSVFGRDWIIFSDEGGQRPDTVGSALVAKTLIKAVQAGYCGHTVPSWVSGHTADGRPTAEPHLAAVPLLDAGWAWSKGHLMGLALVLPRAIQAGSARARCPDPAPVSDLDRTARAHEESLLQALAAIHHRQDGDHEPVLRVRLFKDKALEWTVSREFHPARSSLKPQRYVETASTWATVTPIALDRHPKAEDEVEEIIATACERIGLPRPVAIRPNKHSAVTGAVSARPAARSPAWTGWALPGSLKGRPLTHAVVRFAEPVEGPVILGAGRFVGLGLCLGLDDGAAP